MKKFNSHCNQINKINQINKKCLKPQAAIFDRESIIPSFKKRWNSYIKNIK